ncbi:MAG: hypothetical protein ACK4QW_13745 [Alphaproteobacteria bacterium]
MRRALVWSLALHLGIVLLAVVGVPMVHKPRDMSAAPIAVSLVRVSDLTSLPRAMPRPVETPVERAAETPSAAAPETVAEAPPPPRPEPRPEPPKPEPRAEAPPPPPPPPPPQQVAQVPAPPVTEPAPPRAEPPKPEPAKPEPPKPEPPKPEPAKPEPPKPAPAPRPEPKPEPPKPEPPKPQPPKPEPPKPEPTPRAAPARQEPQRTETPRPAQRPQEQPRRNDLADIEKALRDVRRPEPQPAPRREPEPRKPEPQRPEPPKPEPPKRDDLADLAKAVQDLKRSDPPPRQAAASPATASTRFAGELTLSEEDALRRQIERCWSVPSGARDGRDLIVEVRVSLNPDGSVRDARAVQSPRMASDPFYRAAAESAVRAVQRCSPLNVPPNKYSVWREMTLTFNPKDLLG